ncbi:hypothetical protein [Acanthopleuribacter pedis]|uniref:Uncharacterized protein n=1 Tax=Acanthopleuribacter pedis TaxID=442870 RepID=A0A8J7QFG3_9BACT|nr:hypothetical protein [Acanthopleuribacter pedis]MBO1321510.1 hypothetical protein [Acanthopleuribacter pedis]
MLLTEEQERDLVYLLVEHARALMTHIGRDHRDPETGLVHRQVQLGCFVLVEHHRQKLKGGDIKTNGLDLWAIESGAARKKLSVNYVPFAVRFFQKEGKAEWIQTFKELSQPFMDIPGEEILRL